jgi:hypothetical protein
LNIEKYNTTKEIKFFINMSSGSLIINGHKVWYEKFGDGEHPILMIPGAIG